MDLIAIRKRVGNLGQTIPGCLLITSEDFHALCEEVERLENQAKAMEVQIETLRDKLQRVRDWIKFAANSEGGIVAEINDVLEAAEAAGGK